MKHLSNLPELQWLDLSRTAVTDEGLQHLTNLKNLRMLRLNFVRLSDDSLEQIAKLPKLEELEMRGASVSPVGLHKLSEMKSLQRLDLDLTNLNEDTVDALRKLDDVAAIANLPRLEHLSLGHTDVSASALDLLADNLQLRSLYLRGTAVEKDQAALARLSRLLTDCTFEFED